MYTCAQRVSGALKAELQMICLLWVLGPELQSFFLRTISFNPAACCLTFGGSAKAVSGSLSLALVLFRCVTACSAWKELNIGTHVDFLD